MVSYPADFTTSQPQAFSSENIARAWRSIASALDVQMPGWKEINADPRWIGFLTGLDGLTQLPRQRLLDDRVMRKDVEGVVELFRAFVSQYGRPSVREPVQSQAATTRGKPVIYSRDDITRAHQAFMKGAYRGREAEYEALQAEFQRAGREGRIIGGIPLDRSSGR